jgi:hypothetical protein
MGQRPTFATNAAGNLTIAMGGTLRLYAETLGSFPAGRFQWLRNGTIIPGQIAAEIQLHNFSAANAGRYSVIGYNDFGSATNVVANVNMGEPVRLIPVRGGAPSPHIRITGPVNAIGVIEASANFEDWFRIYTNTAATTPLDYVDRSSTNFQQRFYRLVP